MTVNLEPARRRKTTVRWGDLAGHVLMFTISLSFLVPLLLVVAASFTEEKTLARDGYSLWPAVFSTAAYDYILREPEQILRSYGVSVIVAVGGSALSLLVMSLLAYPMSQPHFRLRRLLNWAVLFTLLFNGGIVTWYIVITRTLQLSDTLLVLILPYLVTPFYVLLLRTYFSSLPIEILEAARVEGANEWIIFWRIVVPLSTPALATVGLFTMLQYWNDYFLGLLYLNDSNLYPLQLLLFNILNNINFLNSNPGTTPGAVIALPPTETVRMAMAVLATGPIAFAFSFLQRYFVRGLTLGSVKG
jgi:putative aldouronate transport system permease protein